MAFLDQQFPPTISFGAVGGPGFNTEVVVIGSGDETRNSKWSLVRHSYEVSYAVKTQSDFKAIEAFFLAARGKRNAFRFKDWADYQDGGHGVIGVAGQGASPVMNFADNDSNVYQLYKAYVSGSDTYYRLISKPITGTLHVFVNGVEAAVGVSNGQYTPDYATGKITIGMSEANIASATIASNAIFELGGVVTGQRVELKAMGGTGWAGLSGTWHTATSVDATHFTLGINSSGFGTFLGGTLKYGLQAGAVLTWTGEFDVPCRFDVDQLKAQIVSRNEADGLLLAWESIPIVETRDIA